MKQSFEQNLDIMSKYTHDIIVIGAILSAYKDGAKSGCFRLAFDYNH